MLYQERHLQYRFSLAPKSHSRRGGDSPLQNIMLPQPLDLSLPDGAPLTPETPYPAETVEERGTPGQPNHWVTGTAQAWLSVYLPPHTTSRAALLIVPGGGYAGRAVDHEGHEVARWLLTLGIIGAVLHYRLPQGDALPAPLPLQDARDALHLLRQRAGAWGLRANRVGIIGFSAGGHLASMTGTLLEPQERPNFMILVYPVISMRDGITHDGSRTKLLGDTRTPELEARFSTDENVDAHTPPTLLIHARDDVGVPLANTLRFDAALQAADVSRETLLYERGGHGFSISRAKGESAQWPRGVAAWLSQQGFLTHTQSSQENP